MNRSNIRSPQSQIDHRKTNDTNNNNNNDDAIIYDAIIVGAGWAGLAAANHLVTESKGSAMNNIIVLEGRDYIGGRSRTISLNDNVTVAELGSQWIHSFNENNPAYHILMKTGVQYRLSEYYSEVIYDGNASGTGRPEPIPHTIMQEYHQELLHNGFLAYQEKLQDECPKHDTSLRKVLDDYYQKKEGVLNSNQIRILEKLADSYIAQEYAANLENLSLINWDNDAEDIGDDCHVAQEVGGGFSGIIRNHYSNLIQKKIIKLNCKVTCIDYSKLPVIVRFSEKGKGQDNRLIPKTIKARNVIITVPLGVLKAGVIDFIPKLPASKRKAIKKLGVGLLNKVIMLWEENDYNQLPWPKDKEWIEKIVEAYDKEEEKGGDGGEGGNTKEEQGNWTEFYSPRPLNGRPLLYAFLSGKFAHRIENKADEEILNECLHSLCKIFGVTTILKPKQVVISRWGQDDYSYGSYSYYKVHSTPKHRKQLAKPIQRRLYFAGEATNTLHFGTVHGAIQSGIWAAQKVAAKAVLYR